MKMKSSQTVVACAYSAVLAFAALGAAPRKAAAGEILVTAPMAGENKRTAFRKSVRKLWAEHMIWTRSYIVATIAGTPDAGEASARLLRNQNEIGALFVPYYGAETGAKIGQLLKEDILLASSVVAAGKKGDSVKLKAAEKRWHDNAQDMAMLLCAANANWSKETFVASFDNMMTLTYRQATSRMGKKWAEDIQTFDELYVQGMAMADDIADGIIKQYPEKI